MSNRSVEMYEIHIPLEAVKRLSDEDRYTYYILGHMFNELIFLQKLTGFSLNFHNDVRPARRKPELCQALIAFRMATSKIWEAIQVLRSKEVAMTLMNSILPKMEDGPKRLKDLSVAINSAPWLSGLRNGMGFHFPSFAEWKPYIVPQDNWVDDKIILGTHTGNTYYESSDAIGQHWMFSQFGTPDVEAAVEPMIQQMIDLMVIMNNFLEDALAAFVSEFLLDSDDARTSMGKTIAPPHDSVSIPFWTHMRDRR
ncbi:MAG: hypothetical protein V4582_07970 [Pseudomonadota bacterium]